MRPFFSPPRSLMYLSSSTLVPDPRLQTSRTGSDRGSSQGKDPGSLFYVGTGPRACPSMAPAGVAAPQSRNQLGGEDCLSEALVLSNAKELSLNNRPPGKADPSLRSG